MISSLCGIHQGLYLTSSDDVEPPGSTTWHLVMHQDPVPVFYGQMRPLRVHYLTSSDNGDAPESTCPLATAETHRVHYLTSSDSENAFGYTNWPLATADMYQDPIPAL